MFGECSKLKYLIINGYANLTDTYCDKWLEETASNGCLIKVKSKNLSSSSSSSEIKFDLPSSWSINE